MTSARRLPFALAATALSLLKNFSAIAEPIKLDFTQKGLMSGEGLPEGMQVTKIGGDPVKDENGKEDKDLMPEDLFSECRNWAERGDCRPGGRPNFMDKNCHESCYLQMHEEVKHEKVSGDARDEFYELNARDATGKVLSMENFEGYATVLVTAATVCESSDLFLGTLEEILSVNPYVLEILAFPVDQPGDDIDTCRDAIRSNQKKGDTKVRIMEAVKVNGEDAHPVYKFMKKLFGIEELDASEPHYFFVNPDATLVDHHHGTNPGTLTTYVHQWLRHFLTNLPSREKRPGHVATY